MQLGAGVECPVPIAEEGDPVRSVMPGGTVVGVAHVGLSDRLAAVHDDPPLASG